MSTGADDLDKAGRIRSFIVNNFYVADPDALADDASLLESGIVDSTGVLELVSFLEQQFAVRVADEELLPDNLDSIAKAARFVERKQPYRSMAEDAATSAG